MPGRTSVQRSGRGSPVTTVNCASKARWTLANRSSSIPAAGQPGRRQQSGDLVEHAEHLGDRAAVGVGVDRAWSWPGCRGAAASAVATVVRPGAPAGPQTAITRPWLGAGSSGADGGSGAGWWSVVIASGRASRSSSGTMARTPIRGWPAPCSAGPRRRRRRRGRRGLTRWSTAARSKPGRLDRDDRGVGLAGGRRGEQVVDVDAALEDDEVAPAAEQAERPGLPGRAGREQQDDPHPRRTTVRLGAS